MRKLWLDDIRDPPNGWKGWNVARNNDTALGLAIERVIPVKVTLVRAPYDVISFDFDLGAETSEVFLKELCKMHLMPRLVLIHSANPVGVEILKSYVQSYNHIYDADIRVVVYDYLDTLRTMPPLTEETLLKHILE